MSRGRQGLLVTHDFTALKSSCWLTYAEDGMTKNLKCYELQAFFSEFLKVFCVVLCFVLPFDSYCKILNNVCYFMALFISVAVNVSDIDEWITEEKERLSSATETGNHKCNTFMIGTNVETICLLHMHTKMAHACKLCMCSYPCAEIGSTVVGTLWPCHSVVNRSRHHGPVRFTTGPDLVG